MQQHPWVLGWPCTALGVVAADGWSSAGGSLDSGVMHAGAWGANSTPKGRGCQALRVTGG